MGKDIWLESINIKGFRPFRDFTAKLGPLEVIVGANGSGKTALFEFLRFLRDGMSNEIPPEIIPGGVGRQVFHVTTGSIFSWDAEIGFASHDVESPIHYAGTLLGPLGSVQVSSESVESVQTRYINMDVDSGTIYETDSQYIFPRQKRNQLTLGFINYSIGAIVGILREYIRSWSFYSGFSINNQEIRRAGLVEQEPTLREDARNLNTVLHYLFTEHRPAFDEVQDFLRSCVPNFKSLSVKARGGPGEIMTFWKESGIDSDLSLTDLSDGVLRLLCWGVLCVHPKPPTLICLDEPDQGLHPRTLPILAGMLQKASQRTQIIVATHSSYFLTQFDLDQVAVMRKDEGGVAFIKPATSKTLTSILSDFGSDEIEALHRSDELERLP